MKEAVLQVFWGMVGTLGFCLMFNVDKKRLWAPVIGGGLSWAVFLLYRYWHYDVFWSTFIASAVVGIYGEIMARRVKAPTTVFFMPACVPLIPGANLYYAMAGLIRHDYGAFGSNGRLLILYALGIASGIGVIMELDAVRLNILARRERKK